MGLIKRMFMNEKEEESEEQKKMLDADEREEEWKAGIVSATFSREYLYPRSQIYEQKKELETFDDAVERIAWNNFKNDMSAGDLPINDDTFEINIGD
jgi:hypothetical protein